jgi:hypothetical protein
VRVGALEPGVGDEAVGRLREVDAVPADVRVGVLAGGGAGEPAGGAHVVVVRAAAAAAGAESTVLVTCSHVFFSSQLHLLNSVCFHLSGAVEFVVCTSTHYCTY